MSPRQLTHNDYTVGWLCVLESELDAARALLDDEDEPLPPGVNDDNAYLLGRMGEHNVVIASPESYGTNPAIQTVTNMVRTFPRIRFGLMVGVGGGAPKSPHPKDSRKDIRLGDVVVGEPRGNHSGVLQYDLGKWKDNNPFQIESHLNKPPVILFRAMNRAKSDHRFGKSKMLDFLREVMNEMRALPELEGFQFPGRQQDLLFNADYAHVEGEDCQNCDIQRIENRVHRTSENPVIHYGLIASGNAVMRSAQRRDELRDSNDVLCFEMEAAGLMNYFPCVVIRGICDYADGHKNKQWQPYAAVVAGAYAKDLLRVIHPGEVINLEMAADIIKKFGETISNIDCNVSKIRTAVNDDLKHKVLQWLSPIDYGEQQSEFLGRRAPKTGQWLLESPEFQAWFKQSKQTLFCPGIAGAGKTIMTSVVIDHVNAEYGNASDVGIAYIYCNYRSQQQQRPKDVLLSLLKQLARGHQEVPSELLNLYDTHSDKGTRPTDTEIRESLISVTRLYSRAFVIIDALDENYSLDTGAPHSLLTELFHIQRHTALNLFSTSRDIPEITAQFNECIWKEITAQSKDILYYVDSQMLRLCPSQISRYPEVQDLVRNTIVEIARGMFLLAKLHMESLLGEPTIGDLEIALMNLPCGETRLKDTYMQAVERIGNQSKGYIKLARRTLAWLTYSKRALSLPEIQHALAVRTGVTSLDEKFIPDAITLGSICAGLIIVDQKTGIIDFIHYTTKEYFESTSEFSEAKIDISATCITYLSLEAFNDGFCLTDDSFDLRMCKNPFYDYAARNWAHHARETSGEPEGLILEFLSSEAKLSGSCQAMMVDESHYRFFNYSQKVPRQMAGVHLAAQFGFMKAMINLVWKGHEPDPKNSHGRTPLSLAAENGHTALVWLLLTMDQVEPDPKDENGQTPLSWAAVNGHEDVILLLLTVDKVGLDSRDNHGRTPLSWAAEQGHAILVWLLLRNNRVDPDSRDNYGRTPLSWAAEQGNETVVWLLLRNDQVDPDSMSESERTPLSWAAEKGHEAVVWLLLRNDRVNPDSMSESKRTPLSWAAENGHENVVWYLATDERVEMENKDSNYDQTALYLATTKGHEGAVRLLLDHGANPNVAKNDGQTPVNDAAISGHLQLVQLLLDRGADPNIADKHGCTPVYNAAYEGYLEVIQLLLDRGADPNTADNNGWTPFNRAAKKGYLNVVQLLLDRGADLNAADNNGWTPIHLAAFEGCLDVVELLLDRGADLNAADNNGRTPIHFAVSEDYLNVVQLLLDRGADLNAADYDGWTPIHHAGTGGHLEIFNLLKEDEFEIWSSAREILFGTDQQ